MRLTRVDLPEPVGPTRARLVPAGILSEMPCSTSTGLPFSAGVSEVEIAEFDVALNLRTGRRGHASRSSMVGFGCQQLVDADDRSGAAFEEIDDIAQGDDGPGEHQQVGGEGDEIIEVDAVGEHLMAADEKGDHHGYAKHEFEGGPEHAHEADQAESAADVFPVGALESFDLRFFLGEGANEAGAGEIFLGLGGDVGEHGLDALEALVNPAAHELDEDAGEGHGGQRGEGQERG